ncbi:MAG: hypothetical protein LBE98_01000 [Puniceicoccales bacterium]|jgi:hypothetical protein|nr:hypothetical protein [Puniceicoccales bacterium]
MGKKILVAAAIMVCLIFCRGSASVDPLNRVIGELKDSTEFWSMEAPDRTNAVTFENNGSISVASIAGDIDSGIAANVEFSSSEFPENDKKNSLLTVTFNNNPSVETGVINFRNPNYNIMAHIYAYNTTTGQSAVDINLAEGVNLSIAEDGTHHPVLVAYSNVTGTEDDGNSVATAIQAANTNSVTIENLASLTAVSLFNSNFNSDSFSASAGIGAAAANDSSNSSVEGLNVTFGDGNILTSSSSSINVAPVFTSSGNSASAGIGAAAVNDDTGNSEVKGLNVTFGDGNILTSSSIGFPAGVSAGIGAAKANGNSTANNLDIRFEDNNGLAASSYGTHSASTGVGAASTSDSAATAVTGLYVQFQNDNGLTASSYSYDTYSASTGVGAALASNSTASTASSVRVNMNGNQSISALACVQSNPSNAKVNAFGADNTDAGDDFGWRVGIFAAGEDIVVEEDDETTIARAINVNSTVNILAAKLGKEWEITDGVATATLGGNQGTSSADYARAFALGNDFQIYIGGMADPDTHGFTPVSALAGTINVVNIIGAISRGRDSAATTGSSLTIDNAWTVNTYGPVQDLANIEIKGGGEWNVYGPAEGLSDIHVMSGVLHIAKDTNYTNFNGVIGQIQDKITYVDPITRVSCRGGDGEIGINADNYPWNGSSGGSLALGAGHRLVLYVDSSQMESIQTPFLEKFRLVTGYVSIDAGMENALVFNGGKIALANDSNGDSATVNYWLIRSGANESVEAVAEMLGMKDSFDPNNFVQENVNLFRLSDTYAASLFEESFSEYEWLDGESAVYLFNDQEHGISGLYIGTELEQSDDFLGEVYANVELAALTVTAHNLLTNAISDRLTRVKGCLADPFIYAIYGHAHQDELTRRGYRSNMGGFVLGADNVWDFPNERYIRIGAAFGYVHGKTKFSDSIVDAKESTKHDIYVVELFGAYEFFNDKQLKTNVGVTFGYGRGNDTLDLGANVSGTGSRDTKIKSDNFFAGIEFLKNLYAYKGCHFGLWLRANYNHVAQKEHEEMVTALMGMQHVSSVNHNFLTTVLGLNLEKEILDAEYADKRWLLSLRTGWECQALRKHSDATITFDNDFGGGKIKPVYGQPGKNAAIVILGISKKLNTNLSMVGSYTGRFNREISNHSLSCGAEYSF